MTWEILTRKQEGHPPPQSSNLSPDRMVPPPHFVMGAFVNHLRLPVASACFVPRDSADGGPEIQEFGPGAGSPVLWSTESTESQGYCTLPVPPQGTLMAPLRVAGRAGAWWGQVWEG